MWNRAADSNSTTFIQGIEVVFFYVLDEGDFYVHSLCVHVAVINYFYTFCSWNVGLKPSSRLPAVVASLHRGNSGPPRDQQPLTPDNQAHAPVLSLIKLGVIGVSLQA